MVTFPAAWAPWAAGAGAAACRAAVACCCAAAATAAASSAAACSAAAICARVSAPETEPASGWTGSSNGACSETVTVPLEVTTLRGVDSRAWRSVETGAAWAGMPAARTRPEAATTTAAWRPTEPALAVTALDSAVNGVTGAVAARRRPELTDDTVLPLPMPAR